MGDISQKVIIPLFQTFYFSNIRVPYYELGDMTGLALLNKIVAGVRPTIETDKMDKEVAALLRREQFLVFLTLFL